MSYLQLREDRTAIDDLRSTLTHARLCHQAWWVLFGTHPLRERICEVYNRYLLFFDTITPALSAAFIIELASVFGGGSKEITIRLLPNVELEPEFADLWKRGRQLYKYRSQIIAHRDLSLFLANNPVWKKGFTHNAVKAILDDSIMLFDRLAAKERFEPLVSLSCEDDLLSLVRDLSPLLPRADG